MSKKLFRKKEWDLKTFDGDILLNERADRRVLPDVPDPEGKRSQFDRRGVAAESDRVEAVILNRKSGTRFIAGFPVTVSFQDTDGHKKKVVTVSEDISETGILLRFSEPETLNKLKDGRRIELKFEIPPGSMPEGREMKVHTAAVCVRTFEKDGESYAGFEFVEDLRTYIQRHKDRYLYIGSLILLLGISLMIALMRAESIIYFKYNALLYSYSLVAALLFAEPLRVWCSV